MAAAAEEEILLCSQERSVRGVLMFLCPLPVAVTPCTAAGSLLLRLTRLPRSHFAAPNSHQAQQGPIYIHAAFFY